MVHMGWETERQPTELPTVRRVWRCGELGWVVELTDSDRAKVCLASRLDDDETNPGRWYYDGVYAGDGRRVYDSRSRLLLGETTSAICDRAVARMVQLEAQEGEVGMAGPRPGDIIPSVPVRQPGALQRLWYWLNEIS
jgi:hypothetical protein